MPPALAQPLPRSLPPRSVMLRAFRSKDIAFDGRFIVAVKTTGIFCRPTCRAKPPLSKNIEFFISTRDALLHGYRACKRCKPLDAPGSSTFQAAPPIVARMLALIDQHWPKPVRTRLLVDAGFTLGAGVTRAQREFAKHTGLSYASYQRSRRMGEALTSIRQGAPMHVAQSVAGFDSSSGFREAIKRLLGETSPRTDAPYLHAAWIQTPLGPMLAVASSLEGREGLVTLDWIDRKGLEQELLRIRARLGTPARPLAIVASNHPVLALVRDQLDSYFTGQRTTFDVPLAAHVGTPFQERVWAMLRTIPHGFTRSYAQQAQILGNPQAVRAVALANGKNFRSIIIPCHRVIGSDGSLTGYGGGLDRKRWLLDLERAGSRQAPGAASIQPITPGPRDTLW